MGPRLVMNTMFENYDSVIIIELINEIRSPNLPKKLKILDTNTKILCCELKKCDFDLSKMTPHASEEQAASKAELACT